MPQSADLLKTALRVLLAVMDRRQPDPQDLEALRRFAPDCDDYADDDLACEVIQRASQRPAQARVQ